MRFSGHGEVAQLVEHTTENRGVVGSIPTLAIYKMGFCGDSSCLALEGLHFTCSLQGRIGPS